MERGRKTSLSGFGCLKRSYGRARFLNPCSFNYAMPLVPSDKAILWMAADCALALERSRLYGMLTRTGCWESSTCSLYSEQVLDDKHGQQGDC
mmetsp:Transcript_39795/g.72275  ORF Transcript_39795/g.72275 Transcript_39795/m.72275 type:complete len:93 (+) Transcript_39795:653-931(+)